MRASARLAAAFFGLGLMMATAPGALADRAAGVTALHNGDFATALTELKPLAEAGDAASQFDIGAMYDNGLGVPQDRAEAARWYLRAARQGDQTAMFNLGVMYEDGEGVGKDPVQAYVYYALAVEQGPPYAARNRDKVKSGLTADQLARADELVRAFAPVPEKQP
ncbi:sel1 repeat family protein [Oleomonas cavernae]|uniref:Sel1 repeat family protein n=1 Tax=Oleomonas cavernae TaxID=2320859 RepID=A0A418WBB5_9PROT|nr:tetratricopeptide repeat protein [Oleomonas cavernae]RJF87327.1 sel1 repeat family protein [Oleomonas cavernae]